MGDEELQRRRASSGRAVSRRRATGDQLGQALEPAQPFLPGNGCVCRRGRREHEQRRIAEPALLQAVLGPLAERAAVGLLADERDHARPELTGELLEPFGAAGEISRAEVARAGSRAEGGVRDADAERKQVELLGRVEQARGQPGGMEQAPEVVARVREVGARSVREAPRVDAAKHDGEARVRAHRERRRAWAGRRLCGFGLAGLEAGLEGEANALGECRRGLSFVGLTGCDDLDAVVGPSPAVAAEVALLLAQRPQPLFHGRQRYATVRTEHAGYRLVR